MTERLGPRVRPTGMRLRVLGMLLVLPLVAAGCGDGTTKGPGAGAASSTPTRGPSVACLGHASPAQASVDLDGDGTPDHVEINGAPVGGGCRDAVIAEVGGRELVAALPGDLPVSPGDLAAVRIPGRTGDLLLAIGRHPRGGFQPALYGYADGKLAELTADGQPVFPFVATDVLTDPISARCVDGAFEVLHARRHEPIGVVPAWDVDRTTYTVDGNAVTKGATTEVADNVLEKDFHEKYADLVGYQLFENCRVDS